MYSIPHPHSASGNPPGCSAFMLSTANPRKTSPVGLPRLPASTPEKNELRFEALIPVGPPLSVGGLPVSRRLKLCHLPRWACVTLMAPQRLVLGEPFYFGGANKNRRRASSGLPWKVCQERDDGGGQIKCSLLPPLPQGGASNSGESYLFSPRVSNTFSPTGGHHFECSQSGQHATLPQARDMSQAIFGNWQASHSRSAG